MNIQADLELFNRINHIKCMITEISAIVSNNNELTTPDILHFDRQVDDILRGIHEWRCEVKQRISD